MLGIVENPLGRVDAQLLFNIGVALILFHGGVGISLRVIPRTAAGLGLLVLPGVFITALIVGVVVALAVVATLVLQATTAGLVARRLGLIEEPGPETAG